MSLAPTFGSQQPHRPAGSPITKAVLDRVGAALILLPCAPWLLIVGLVLWLQDDRPVLVRESRIGQWGRRFDLLRFRTDDGRMGALLRRCGLDELPQLINVAKGDMSFVGPRPAASLDDERIPDPALWLSVKPGLTGPWTTSRSPSTRESASLELDRYLRNWSLTTDLTILWHSLLDALGQPLGRENR